MTPKKFSKNLTGQGNPSSIRLGRNYGAGKIMERKGVGVIFRNNKGEILLQLRDEKAPRYPNCWAFFGGGIEEGETPEAALKREIEEELKIKVKHYSFFKKYDLVDIQGDIEGYYFIIPLNASPEDLKKNLKEGKDLNYFSPEKIKELNTPDYEEQVFNDLSNLKLK